jgi:tRNA A37 threonylcarbamoyltransferase TsaD
MSNDQWLKLAAATWLLILAAIAATQSPFLLAAVLIGATLALTAARAHR